MLVGRETDLASIERAIVLGKSTLILVTSEPRMGKSALLREVGARTESQSYRVFPARIEANADRSALSIDKATTQEFFSNALSNLTLYPDLEGRDDGLLGGSARASMSLDRPQAMEDPSKPILILIDGYRPAHEFEDWFVETFIPALKDALPPRVVVVAAYAGDVARLVPVTALQVTLAPIPQESLEAYLGTLNETLTQPMSEAEIHEYAEALSEDPRLIDALERLLAIEHSA